MRASPEEQINPHGMPIPRPSLQTVNGRADQTPVEPPRPLMRELPSAAAYPADALGSILQAAAESIKDKTQASIAICGQSVLVTAALAAQSFNNVELPTGQLRPVSLFAISIASSGDRKSSADDHATWPIRQREAALRATYDEEHPDYINAELAWSKARDKAINACKGNRAQIKHELDALGHAPQPPLEPELTTPDPTLEGLCKLFQIGQPSMGVFADEGGQFINGHAMNSDNRLKTAAGFSSLWDNGSIKRTRAGDGHTTLVGRRVSMHLLAQPGVAAKMLGDRELADQGLLSRILVTAPDSAAGTRLWHESKPESDVAIKRYGARILSLLEHLFPTAEGKPNELAPHTLSLSAGARSRWIEFFNFVEKQIGTGGRFAPVRGLANKAAEHATRIAGVIATIERELTGGGEIQTDDLNRGIQLAQFHISEALRLFEAKQASPELFEADKLLSWLRYDWKGRPLVSVPDIYQKGPNAIRDKAAAEKLVGILVDHGSLVKAGPGTVNGVRRRETFQLVEAQS